MIDKAFFNAAFQCLLCLDKSLHITDQPSADGYASKVDYAFKVDSELVAFADAKSDQVLCEAGRLLPPRGFILDWSNDQSLMEKVILNVGLPLARDGINR